MNINELKKLVKETISESSLSRVEKHISEHDCAIITAFRKDPNDGTLCKDSIAPSTYQQVPPSTKESKVTLVINQLNNRDLRAYLLDKGYGVTDVAGSYIENYKTDIEKEVKEDSLFVVNLNDDPNFVSNLQSMGIRYCQDSVMIIPMGGEKPFFIGTNYSSFPGFDQTIDLGDISYAREREFMTRVRNRPLSTIPTNTVNEGLQTYDKLTRLERMAVRAIAGKIK